jgi:DNA polymerase-3 subunit alpha
MGITVLAPDVNESEIDFAVVYDETQPPPKRRPNQPVSAGGKLRDALFPKIRFGLGGVKGVGGAALESILEARMRDDQGVQKDEKQPYLDLWDFTARVDLRRVNKGVLEALVQCGAMDSLHDPRAIGRDRALAAIDAAIELGKRASADRASGQTDLFGMLLGDEGGKAMARRANFPEVAEPWSRPEKLKREKSALGFYVSGHPLDGFREELKRFCNASTASLARCGEGSTVAMGGMVEDYRERPTKTGGKIAFFYLDDPFGRVEVIVRNRQVEAFREQLQSGIPLLITGVVKAERDAAAAPVEDGGDSMPDMKLLLDNVTPLVQAFRAKTRAVRVRVHVDRLDKKKLADLRRALEAHPGTCPVVVQLDSSADWRVMLGNGRLTVEPSEAMMMSLERLFGEKVCELR